MMKLLPDEAISYRGIADEELRMINATPPRYYSSLFDQLLS
jgi:hypothetical protein